MSAADDAMNSIEGFLRRPGELFADEWKGYQARHDGPEISTIWYMEPRDEAPNEAFEFEDEMAKAWDLLCDSSVFLAWFEANEAVLRGGDASNVLTVRDGGAETLRFSRTGNLNMTVPVEMLRTTDDLVAEFQRVILAMLGRRAGAPPPELD